jgi:hypothetical protein
MKKYCRLGSGHQNARNALNRKLLRGCSPNGGAHNCTRFSPKSVTAFCAFKHDFKELETKLIHWCDGNTRKKDNVEQYSRFSPD